MTYASMFPKKKKNASAPLACSGSRLLALCPLTTENSISDPEQLAALEQRVSLFETLKRKYGGSIAEVIAFGEHATERMQKVEGRDAELERLVKEIENVRSHMNRAGEALRSPEQKLRRNFLEHPAQPSRSRIPAI